MRNGYDYKVRKSHNSGCIVLLIMIIIIGSIIFTIHKSHENPKIVTPIANTHKPTSSLLKSIFNHEKNPDELEQLVKKTVGSNWNNYSVLVEDLNSDFKMGIDETVIYTGASVNKVPILAVLYYLEQKGEINMDQIITLQQDDIQDYGTGTIRYDPPGTTYTVKTLAKLMMEKSDNTAAYLIGNYVLSLDIIQKTLNNWNIVQTDMVNNKTSNQDMANLFEKIIDEKIANHANTLEMLAFLKNSDFEDRIPALLPNNVTVYHKIGNGPGNVHDVGVVIGPTSKYYIGILTSDITDEENASKTAALISKVVYDYMQN
jgi:beta-lactamase class A